MWLIHNFILQLNIFFNVCTNNIADAILHIKKKLVTNEDPFHVHRILGLSSVISYIYRYGTYENNMGFGYNTWFDLTTIFLHTGLSYSSFIFHVLKKRIIKVPLVIYEEYRLHAIIFTTRGTCVMLFYYLYDYLHNNMGIIYNNIYHFSLLALVLCHHKIADLVTYNYGSTGVTAVRAGNINYEIRLSLLIRYFYSFYQFLAIASHLQVGPHLLALGFNTHIAIQTSAFMMTLRKKGLIHAKTHGFIYTGCLFLSIYQMCQVYQPSYFIGSVFILFIFRCKYEVNKYLLWILYGVITSPFFGSYYKIM